MLSVPLTRRYNKRAEIQPRLSNRPLAIQVFSRAIFKANYYKFTSALATMVTHQYCVYIASTLWRIAWKGKKLFFKANCPKNCSSRDTITQSEPTRSVAITYATAVKKTKPVCTVLWPFTTMKPSLMLGTSTSQELLFVRIMSKSHTSAWKTIM